MNNKLKLFALLASALICAPSFASEKTASPDLHDLEIKFGGWSVHSPKSEAVKEDLNQNHMGLGIAYFPLQSKNNRHRLGGEVWYMKDVFDNASFSAMASYKYRIDVSYLIDSIDLGFNLGIISDTERNYTVSNGVYTGYSDESVTRLAASPQVTVNFTESMHVDVSYSRHDSYSSLAQNYDTLFFRFGYRFKI